jgi:hypothetical protein
MGRFLVVGAGKKKKNLLQNVCTCGDSRLLQLDNNLQVGNKKSPSLSLSLCGPNFTQRSKLMKLIHCRKLRKKIRTNVSHLSKCGSVTENG